MLQLNKFAFDHFVWNSMNARYVKLLVLVSAPLSTHIIWIKFLPIKIVLTIAQFDAKQICTVMLSSGSQSHLMIQLSAHNGARKLTSYFIFIPINAFIFSRRKVFRFLWSVRWNKLLVWVTVSWLTTRQSGAVMFIKAFASHTQVYMQ